MSRRRFGATWWGRAWISALEDRARLDPNRLPRGRTYARHSRAERIAIEPGRITALVAGRRAHPYRVDVRVRELTAEEWERVINVIASRAGHAAALLDGELLPAVDDDAREVGVELLPDVGEIQPRCSCPDWADPCKHSAAVCYLVADELDTDPFLLFELRGKSREQVLGGIRATRGVLSGGERAPTSRRMAKPSVIPARDAFAAWDAAANQSVSDLPELPGPVSIPVEPAPWPSDPPPAAGIDAERLQQLAMDAAGRARAMLADDSPSMLSLTDRHDLARRAASALGSADFDELAQRVEIGARSLARLAIAWREGGGPGVDALTSAPWRPSPEPLIAARQAATEAGYASDKVRVKANRVTIEARIQLRYGNDRRWYRLEKNSGAWELTGPAADDPADLL